MFNEIEVKVLNVDVEEVKLRAIRLGAKKVKEEMQTNYIFNLQDTENGYVRIRRALDLMNNEEKIILCLKKINKTKTARNNIEYEFEVSSFDTCFCFLTELGFTDFKVEKKHRESYFLNDVLIEIDTYDKDVFPYPIIELESIFEKKLYDVVKLLDIPKENITSKRLTEIKKEMGLI